MKVEQAAGLRRKRRALVARPAMLLLLLPRAKVAMTSEVF